MSRKCLNLAIAIAFALSCPVFAQSTSLEDLQDLTYTTKKSGEMEIISQDHWAYKTLENITRKYDKNSTTFDINKPLTRQEAAILLVNLVGKVEASKFNMSDFDKGQVSTLQNVFQKEIRELQGQVSHIAMGLNTLQGKVAKIEEDNKKSLKFGYGKEFQVTGGINLRAGFFDDNYGKNLSIPHGEFGIAGDLTDNIEYRLSSQMERNPSVESTMLSDAFIAYKGFKNHKVFVGNVRQPIGQEGARSPFSRETIELPMHARNLSDVRDVGVKVAGRHKFVEYYSGVFNGSRELNTENDRDMDIANWINFKPFANHENWGELVVGGGYAFGKNQTHYDVAGAYLGYKLGKVSFESEYGYSKGIDGAIANYGRKAQGYFTRLGYDLTDKNTLILQYDWYDPNTQIVNGSTTEYTIGLDHRIAGDNIRFISNYVFVQNPDAKDDHRLVFESRFAL